MTPPTDEGAAAPSRADARGAATPRPEGVVDVSIVIVTHNSGDVIDECLAALPAAADDLVAEAIVVDNASTDRTVQAVAAHPGVTLIRNRANVGFAAACNAGMAAMRGRHVLLLNPDATLSPRAIPRLVAILEKFPRVGLVAPTLLGSTGKPPRPPLLPCPTLGRMFVAQTPVRHIARWLPRRRWRPVPDVPIAAGYLTGACLLIRGALLGDVGPLDARYFFSFEDVDYADRAVAAGWTLLWTDAVAVQHGGGASTRQFDAGWRHWQFLRGARRYFASRHAGGAFALAWPLFKVLHAQSLVAMWLESGTKRTAYARLGHPAAAAKHDRRRRLAGGFLSRYAWRIFSW